MPTNLSNEEAASMLRAGMSGPELGMAMRNKTRANRIRALAANAPPVYYGTRTIRRGVNGFSVPNAVRRAALGKGAQATHLAKALGVKLRKSSGGTRRRRNLRRKSTRKH
jgi:hypothetical protein